MRRINPSVSGSADLIPNFPAIAAEAQSIAKSIPMKISIPAKVVQEKEGTSFGVSDNNFKVCLNPKISTTQKHYKKIQVIIRL